MLISCRFLLKIILASVLSSSSRAFLTPHYTTPAYHRAFRASSSFFRMSSLSNAAVVHAPNSLLPDWMLEERTRLLTDNSDVKAVGKNQSSSVVYWMQRDVRVSDNWALLFASHLANTRKVPLRVIYALPPPPPTPSSNDATLLPPALIDMPMTARHGNFLLGGLECVYNELKEKNIPLHIVMPESDDSVGETVCDAVLKKYHAQIIVCDFSPLRQFRQWMELQAAPILEEAGVPLIQVDAHNIVPVWTASDKREVGARTLRPRIHRVITRYLQAFPSLPDNTELVALPDFERDEYETFLQMDESVPVVDWQKPGTKAGMKQFDFFVKHGLKKFDELRNDPTQKHVCSNLSPWINHGHISFQRIVMDVKKLNKYANGTKSFIEEGVIRRELSDNYVYYSPNNYDSLTAAAGWAQETLETHASDPREYVYSLQELERGETHDDLWNAAQLQVVREGQMHGFLRMYWAKKILEWTESPEIALQTAQYFNDKYALDGRDPNGFVGVGWSIMGIHDQGWKEREVFGKIRFMNYNGCKRKFKVTVFVGQYEGAAQNASKAASKKKSGQKRQQTTQAATKGAAKKRKG